MFPIPVIFERTRRGGENLLNKRTVLVQRDWGCKGRGRDREYFVGLWLYLGSRYKRKWKSENGKWKRQGGIRHRDAEALRTEKECGMDEVYVNDGANVS